MGENRLRRCAHCGQPFTPDARNAHHQRYCPAPACRLASKRASQNKWLAKPENRDYHRGPAAVARVQAWRRAHPGYSRRPTGAPVTAVPVPAAAASAVPPLTEPPTATTTTAPADPLTKTAGNAGLDHKSAQDRVMRLVIGIGEVGRISEHSYPWRCKLTEGWKRCPRILPRLTLVQRPGVRQSAVSGWRAVVRDEAPHTPGASGTA